MRLKLFLAVLLFPFAALADSLPRPDADGIADLANLLSPAEETQLRAEIQDIRARTGVTLVVITMDRLANHGGAGQSLEAYATALFNTLGIGDAKKDDGVLLLVARDDRAMRIELGSGFSWSYDSRAQTVIDDTILPRFRDGRMAEGVLAGVAGIKDMIALPFAEGRWVGLTDSWPLMLIGAVVLWVVRWIIRKGKSIYAAYVRCPSCGQPGLQRQHEVMQSATSYSSGSGITHLSCSFCSFVEDRPYTIAMLSDSSSSSSGSSGGSGGGGSSSGGGASGHW
jgi:uncharacterized protein